MNDDIKAIVLDVDGVIVGDKIGLNSPSPTKEAIKALEKVKLSGHVVSFCTGKPYLAVKKIIEDAELFNLHVTDGGGVMMDPVSEIMLVKNSVNKDSAAEVINKFIGEGVYMEFYTDTSYFVQKNQKNDITNKHSFVLTKAPKFVTSLEKESQNHEITKLMLIAKDQTEIPHLQKLFDADFKDKLNLRWGLHPVINPLQFGVITARGISKGQMVLDMLSRYSIKPENVLSIGDSTSDWDFMQVTGYVATLENGTPELKNLVSSFDSGHSYIGKHVNDNGIIDIFKHFKLI